jgi:hypothetical protein
MASKWTPEVAKCVCAMTLVRLMNVQRIKNVLLERMIVKIEKNVVMDPLDIVLISQRNQQLYANGLLLKI